MICYLLIFVGAATYNSGKKLYLRLKKVDLDIQNQLIQESMRGNTIRSRAEIEKNTSISNYSIFSQVHQLYLAPLIVTVIAGIFLKLISY